MAEYIPDRWDSIIYITCTVTFTGLLWITINISQKHVRFEPLQFKRTIPGFWKWSGMSDSVYRGINIDELVSFNSIESVWNTNIRGREARELVNGKIKHIVAKWTIIFKQAFHVRPGTKINARRFMVFMALTHFNASGWL